MLRKILLLLVVCAVLADLIFAIVTAYYPPSWGTFHRVSLWLAVNIAALAVIETGFRLAHRVYTGAPYVFIPKLRHRDMYMEPHPYIPVVYKRHFLSQRPMKANYELNSGKGYMYGQYTSNNFRHLDGPKGSRDIVVPKPAGQLRVVCLGASTTANYIEYEGVPYSYPMELEKILKEKFPGKDVIVHNCGHGGWTSAEIMVDFMLNIFDTQPDIVVIYHACNDLPSSLIPGFQRDYSHSRRNLGEVEYLYRIASLIPNFPLKSYNFVLNRIFPYMNPRFGVVQATTKGTPDLDAGFMGLQTYGRNIEHIIRVCKASGTDVVLSTFAHYLYDKIKDSKHHIKYRRGIMMENDLITELAKKHSLPLADNFNGIPSELQYFVDSIHFTPEGMRLQASNIAEKLIPLAEKRF